MRKVKFNVPVGTPNDPCVFQVPITGYLTPTAGLVVHTGVTYDHTTKTVVKRRNYWVISQYPSGMAAFRDIPTKAEALNIVEKYMSKLNWVGLTGAEAVAANPQNEISDMVSNVRRHLDALASGK